MKWIIVEEGILVLKINNEFGKRINKRDYTLLFIMEEKSLEILYDF